jgi:hypothetical protein
VESAPTGTLADLLASARVEEEYASGYDRALFPHWEDFDNDRCNTREEVLVRDSRSPAQVDPYGCKVLAGDWLSSYDNLLWDDPAELDIDHVVALSEAWASGAWKWNSTRREQFANDLSDARTLRAVTSSVNRQKSDKDLAEWLPPHAGAVCGYVADWVAVKVRWGLSFDAREFAVARQLAGSSCSSMTAPVTLDVVPVEVPGTPAPGGISGGGDVFYRNCGDARARGAAPLRRDDPGYRPSLDGDGDGIACE